MIGPIATYAAADKKGQAVAPDVEAWFKADKSGGNPHIVAQWADAHNSIAQAWVTGDPTQSDLPGGRADGLQEALRILQDVEGAAIVGLAHVAEQGGHLQRNAIGRRRPGQAREAVASDRLQPTQPHRPVVVHAEARPARRARLRESHERP